MALDKILPDNPKILWGFNIALTAAIIPLWLYTKNSNLAKYKEDTARVLNLRAEEISDITEGEFNGDNLRPDYLVHFKDGTERYFFHKGYDSVK